MIEKYTKYTSLLSMIFFIGAVLFETLYYRRFGIDIFTFISFSEIISIFIGNIPLLLFFALFVFGFIYVLKWLFRGFLDKLSNITKYNLKERQRLNQKSSLITSISLFILFIIVIAPLPYFFKEFIHSELFFFIKAFATLIFIFNLSFPLFLSKQLRDDTNKLFLIIFTISFYTTVFFFANKLVWNVRNQPSKNPSLQIFLKNGHTIATTNKLVYLGKTNNYIFLYNNTDQIPSSAALVINMDEVDSLKIFKQVAWVTPF